MKTKPKKRNPQDSTRRNVQAANKKIAALRERVCGLELRQTMLEQLLLNLGSRCWEACGTDWSIDAKNQLLTLEAK